MVDVVIHQGQLYANMRYGIMYVFLELYDLASPSSRSSLMWPATRTCMWILGGVPLRQANANGAALPMITTREGFVGGAAMLVETTGSMAALIRVCLGLGPKTIYYVADLEGDTRMWVYNLMGKHKRIKVMEVLSTVDGYRVHVGVLAIVAVTRDATNSICLLYWHACI
jgi:hypothetical protein